MLLSGTRIPVVALAVTGVALVAFDAAISRSGVTIGKSIASAVDSRAEADATSDGLAGFDPAHLHLSNLPGGPGALQRFSVGDRLSLSGRDGAVSNYAIVDVQPLTAKAGESGEDLSRLAIVTAASVDQPSQKLRFIVELGSAPLVPVSRPRAL
jgi:hypothetical protein